MSMLTAPPLRSECKHKSIAASSTRITDTQHGKNKTQINMLHLESWTPMSIPPMILDAKHNAKARCTATKQPEQETMHRQSNQKKNRQKTTQHKNGEHQAKDKQLKGKYTT